MKPSGWVGFALIVALVFPAMAKEPDAVLVLDAKKETVACLVDANSKTLPDCAAPNLCKLFLVQGQRAELRVYNRKFFSDYSITIDAVTTLTGPQIRNLPEAENLTLGTPSFAGPPPSKGGFETISQRTARDILALLLDETQATKPLADLNADYDELNREQAQIKRDINAFDQNYRILYGASKTAADCEKISGSPDAQSLISCFDGEITREHNSPWQGPGHYRDEQEFRNVIVRVQDLIVTVKTFSGVIAGTNILQLAQQLDAEVTQYEKNFITLQQNIESAIDAANLLTEMISTKTEYGGQETNLRTNLRLAQIRASLTKNLKLPLDDAEISQLLKESAALVERRGNELTLGHGSALSARSMEVDPRCRSRVPRWATCAGIAIEDPAEPSGFREAANGAKSQVEVDLRDALDQINAQQGRLLARVNYIYDHSEVPDALPKQIDISGHSGNLIVYYTIRRIENFTRFQVAQVQNPGVAAPASVQGAALPAPGGSTPAPSATATPPTGETSSSGAAPAPDSAGIVVTRGTFYVHDLYKANVVAAFAYSWAKDQNIGKQPQPNPCGGSPGSPDNNCFSPLLNNSSPQLNLILGVDYYFHARDTFYDFPGARITGTPKRSTKEWLLQSTGIMGAVSATQGNNWFLGLFFEPVLGVQLSGGANFTSERRLQKDFQFGAPVDITGDFPTQDARVTKPFISAGLDLGLFRKIFGKLTGIGTSAVATQGK